MAIGKAASVFILYCTAWYASCCTRNLHNLAFPSPPHHISSSNNLALQAKRKTLAANDVLSALSDMEFEEFVPELKTFLEGEAAPTLLKIRGLARCAIVYHTMVG